jgi:hypothetical protein
MTAPVASGWSGCWVGLAPTGKRRLITAHTQTRHLLAQFAVTHNGTHSSVIECRLPTWERLMRRRDFITFLGSGAATWPVAAYAQQPRIAQIGFLGAATAAGYAKLFEALQAGLRDLGYLEGKNIVIHSRWAEENYDRLAALANELVALKVDVLCDRMMLRLCCDALGPEMARSRRSGTSPH